MDVMDVWSETIVEWVNCLDILDAPVKNVQELRDGNFFAKLIEILSQTNQGDIPAGQEPVSRFLQEEYPEFLVENEKGEGGVDELHIASLLLLQASQEPKLHRPMCIKLQHETQIKIKMFLEKLLHHGNNVTRQNIKQAIVELVEYTPKTPKTPPITPKRRPLKDFFNSPVAHTANKTHRLLDERNRELRRLRSELETERYEKVDLQEDLRIQQEKIQSLQMKLQEKSAEMKKMREEWTKPISPQSCKKVKDKARVLEDRQRREIQALEDYSAQLQLEIDKLQEERETLIRKLTSAERQCATFKERSELSERSLETLTTQNELKDRELEDLKMQTEELRAHMQEMRKVSIGEQSFEVENILMAQSPLRALNASEALSSVVDIQLQEAKEESNALKTELDNLNERLASVDQECHAVKEHNVTLQAKLILLESTQQELIRSQKKLTDSYDRITHLEGEKLNLIEESTILKNSLASNEQLIEQSKQQNETLKSDLDGLRNKLKSVLELLNIESTRTKDLESIVSQAKSTMRKNLETIEIITTENKHYETTIESCNIILKDSVMHACRMTGRDTIDVCNSSITDSSKQLESLLNSLEIIQNSKESDITNLNVTVSEMNEKISKLKMDISHMEEKHERNVLELSRKTEAIREADLKISQSECTILQYAEEIDKLKMIADQKEALMKDLTELQKELAYKTTTIESLNQEKTIFGMELLKIKHVLNLLRDEKLTLGESVGIHNKKLFEQFKCMSDVVAQLQDKINFANSTKLQLSQQLKSIEIERDELLETLRSERTDSLQKEEGLNRVMDELNSSLDRLTREMNHQQAEQEDLKKELNRLNELNQDLTEKHNTAIDNFQNKLLRIDSAFLELANTVLDVAILNPLDQIHDKSDLQSVQESPLGDDVQRIICKIVHFKHHLISLVSKGKETGSELLKTKEALKTLEEGSKLLILKLRQELEDSEDIATDYKSKLSVIQSIEAQKSDEISKLKVEIENMQSLVHQAMNERENMSKDHATNASKLNEEIIELKVVLKETKNRKHELMQRVELQQKQSEETRQEMLEIQRKLQSNITQLELEKAELTALIASGKRELDAIETAKIRLENEMHLVIASHRNQLEQQEDRLKEVQNNFETLSKEKLMLLGAIKLYRDGLRALKSAQSEIKQEQLSLMESNKVCLTVTRENIDERLEMIGNELNAWQSTIKDKSYKHSKEISERENEIRELRNSLEGKNEMIADVNVKTEKLLIENMDKDVQIRNLNDEMQSLRTQFIQQNKCIEDHESGKQHLNGILESKEEQISNLASEKSTLETTIQELENNVSTVLAKSSELQQQMHESDEALKALNEQLLTTNKEKDALQKDNERLVETNRESEAQHECTIENFEKNLSQLQKSWDELNDKMQLKQKDLEMLEIKVEQVTKDKTESELRFKELVMNLQEVRASQEALLKTQAKALKEKESHLDDLQKQFNRFKISLTMESDNEKQLRLETETKYKVLKDNYDHQTKVTEELRDALMTERKERCENLEHLKRSMDSLKCAVKQSHPSLEILYDDPTQNVCQDEKLDGETKSDDVNNFTGEDLTKVFSEYLENGIIAMQRGVQYLSDANKDLEIAILEERITSANIVDLREQNTELRTKIQDLEMARIKYEERCRSVEAVQQRLVEAMASRIQLDVLIVKLNETFTQTMCKSWGLFILAEEDSMCDESKHLQAKKKALKEKVADLNNRHSHGLQPLLDELHQAIAWNEKKVQETVNEVVPNMNSTKIKVENKLSSENSSTDLEIGKNDAIRNEVISALNEIGAFSDLVSCNETVLGARQIKREREIEEKLQKQVDQLSKEKRDIKDKLDMIRVRNAKLEKNLDELRKEVKRLGTENSSAEERSQLEELKSRYAVVQEENQRMRKERDDLRKRPTEQDFENRLKEVHNEYGLKLEKIKQKMKTAYNEQMAKLNHDQERALQEKMESLRSKMEQQCRKHTEEIAKYKEHVGDLSSQFWEVGEKLLVEKQEKEAALQELQDLKRRFLKDRTNTAEPTRSNLVGKTSVTRNKTSSLDRRDFVTDARQTACSVEVIKEEVTTCSRQCSVKNIQAMGNAFKAEDEEGEVFDNTYLADMKDGGHNLQVPDMDRLSVLQMRNSLCKPHLKSSYPAETHFHPLVFTEEDIKSGGAVEDVFNDSLSQSLLPGEKPKKRDRTQTSYKRPGPPTPSKNGGRLSLQGNEIRSPNSRILKEQNTERRTTATPRRLKDLFGSSLSRRQDENAPVTPRTRKLSNIFRKPR